MNMTYYRAYRPHQFNLVLEQELVTRVLQQALRKHMLAHAYLFTGPRGVGKTTTARIFAQAVCCEHPVQKSDASYEPCGNCSSCEAISSPR